MRPLALEQPQPEPVGQSPGRPRPPMSVGRAPLDDEEQSQPEPVGQSPALAAARAETLKAREVAEARLGSSMRDDVQPQLLPVGHSVRAVRRAGRRAASMLGVAGRGSGSWQCALGVVVVVGGGGEKRRQAYVECRARGREPGGNRWCKRRIRCHMSRRAERKMGSHWPRAGLMWFPMGLSARPRNHQPWSPMV